MSYDGTRYLVLFGLEKYNAIYNSIRYLIRVRSGITVVFSHNNVKIKIDSYDLLPLETVLTLHNIIMHIKFLINIKIATTIIHSKKNVPTN